MVYRSVCNRKQVLSYKRREDFFLQSSFVLYVCFALLVLIPDDGSQGSMTVPIWGFEMEACRFGYLLVDHARQGAPSLPPFQVEHTLSFNRLLFF